MNRAILYLFICCTLSASCSATRKNVAVNSTSKGAGNDGSSYEKAIIIKAEHEKQGVEAEYAWLGNNYPGYRTRGQALSNYKSKAYDIIHITTSDARQLDVYFDISNFFGKF